MGRQHITRRVSRGTAARYKDIMDQINRVNDETSDAHWGLVEDMKRLLDLPGGTDWDQYDITVLVTESPTSAGGF